MASAHLSVLPQIFRAGLWKGRRFLEMEWVQGLSLSELGSLLPDRFAWRTELFLRLAESLQELHRNGMNHGDLQPGNVLFPAEGTAVLLDPGGGKLQAQGTPRYRDSSIAPGTPASVEGDLYALGQIGKELIPTQSHIFEGICAAPEGRAQALEPLLAVLGEGLDRSAVSHELDVWLGDTFCLSMGARCAQAAASLSPKAPLLAIDLCQEALQWDPNQAQAISLLATIQVAPRRFFWKSWKFAGFSAILMVGGLLCLWGRTPNGDSLLTPAVSSPTAMELLRSPADSIASVSSSAKGQFLTPAQPANPVGWLVVDKLPAQCELSLDQERRLSGARISLPAGVHLLSLHCPDRSVQRASVVIRAFAETRLPGDFFHGNP